MATPAEIHAAADTLVSEGQRPTLAAVRSRLGGGSFTTISEALKTWSGRQTAAPVPQEAAPEAVEAAAKALAVDLWHQAQTHAQARLDADRKALEEARQELEQDRSEAAELADSLAAELDLVKAAGEQLNCDLVAVRAELATALAQVSELGIKAAAAEAGLQECRGRADVLTADLVRERQMLETATAESRAAAVEAAELRGTLSALKSMKSK